MKLMIFSGVVVEQRKTGEQRKLQPEILPGIMNRTKLENQFGTGLLSLVES